MPTGANESSINKHFKSKTHNKNSTKSSDFAFAAIAAQNVLLPYISEVTRNLGSKRPNKKEIESLQKTVRGLEIRLKEMVDTFSLVVGGDKYSSAVQKKKKELRKLQMIMKPNAESAHLFAREDPISIAKAIPSKSNSKLTSTKKRKLSKTILRKKNNGPLKLTSMWPRPSIEISRQGEIVKGTTSHYTPREIFDNIRKGSVLASPPRF
jgi:hypothetical protein